MMGKILKSVVLILVISLGLAGLTYDGATIKSFCKWCAIYTLIQVFANSIYTSCMDYFLIRRINKQTTDRYDQQLKTIVTFTCPCPNKIQQPVSINMSEQNIYKCTQCSKRVSVIIQMNNALTTTPIDMAISDARKLVQGYDEELKLND